MAGELLGYARVSTTDQDAALQVDALQAVGCFKVFVDTGSGALDERPELQRLREQLRPGDTVVVWRLDRLGRSIRHLIDTMTELNDQGVGFRSLTENIDTTTPGGRLVFHLFAALAEFERDLIRDRTKAGLAAARARGRLGGRPRALTSDQVAAARGMYDQQDMTVSQNRRGARRQPRHDLPRAGRGTRRRQTPHREGRRVAMPRRALDRWQVLRAHVEDGVSWVDLAAHHGIPVRTLQRWHAAYQRDGLDGLTDPPRRDRGSHRLPPALQALIEGLALVKPRASVAAITRRAQSAAGDHGWKPPSYSVVRRVVEELDPAIVALAHDGPVSYRDQYELVWRRAAAHPNDLWQADHTELDVLILDAAAAPARPWLTIVEDDHSRAVCGYHVFLDAPSAMNTGLALRQAIWHKPDPAWPMCGIPDVLYVDHGSDFTSHQLAVTALELKMRLVFSAVARPQGRGKIERFFGSINTELLPELPGYLAADQRRPTPVLTLAELSDHIGTFITSTYHQRVHPELGTSPQQAWTRDGWLPRMPDSLESLDELLLTVPKTRIVHRDGIRFQGLRYLATTLAAYVGEAVTIRYDPRDITEIRVFHDNHFLCTAVDVDHQDQTLTLKDIQAARAARRRALRAGINERIAVVAEYLPAYAPRRAAPTTLSTATGASTRQPKLRTYLED